MRLLLDEMLSATVAEQLRAKGHDVAAVQEPTHVHLRGMADCVVLSAGAAERRAVVTDNVPDFMDCHHGHVASGEPHAGLLLFSNRSFPRHRYDLFVGRMIATLERELVVTPNDDLTSWVRWLEP